MSTPIVPGMRSAMYAAINRVVASLPFMRLVSSLSATIWQRCRASGRGDELPAHLPAAVHVAVELGVELGSLSQKLVRQFDRVHLITDDHFEIHAPASIR